jgi:hypothetical protein
MDLFSHTIALNELKDLKTKVSKRKFYDKILKAAQDYSGARTWWTLRYLSKIPTYLHISLLVNTTIQLISEGIHLPQGNIKLLQVMLGGYVKSAISRRDLPALEAVEAPSITITDINMFYSITVVDNNTMPIWIHALIAAHAAKLIKEENGSV